MSCELSILKMAGSCQYRMTLFTDVGCENSLPAPTGIQVNFLKVIKGVGVSQGYPGSAFLRALNDFRDKLHTT